MEDTIKIRKDKVKNVAIVFLSVMLVLTFFYRRWQLHMWNMTPLQNVCAERV